MAKFNARDPKKTQSQQKTKQSEYSKQLKEFRSPNVYDLCVCVCAMCIETWNSF